jgi:hypothetical protein
MFDAIYDDLLTTYFGLCDRHEDAVIEMVGHAKNRRHGEFRYTLGVARKLGREVDLAYLALQRRKSLLVRSRAVRPASA